ncbi:MAG: hypothetical protein ACI4J5_00440 [Oscillospiraceae bacterium]
MPQIEFLSIGDICPRKRPKAEAANNNKAPPVEKRGRQQVNSKQSQKARKIRAAQHLTVKRIKCAELCSAENEQPIASKSKADNQTRE